jgi:hypothetical protein
MWQVSWPKAILTSAVLGALLFASEARSEDIYRLSQNQNGFDLPGVTLPQGQDEVRAADGTTCSAAISGSGAYLDVGIIKNNRVLDSGEFATYGRVVIPLGRTPKRLDCARLYELEVERLQMELSLLKMGVLPDDVEITGSTTRTAAANPKAKRSWVSEGWTANGNGNNR